MLRILTTLILTLCFFLPNLLQAQGMWIPSLLKSLNEPQMRQLGMKMSAEDIYSVNKGSLKDAIVSFGGFCTGEVISPEGLLLTNHHCGYGQIQYHSTVENNYLDDGFWAMSREEELPNPDLTATFIRRIEDVSDEILEGVEDDMPAAQRQSVIDKNIQRVASQTEKEDYEEVLVRPFYKGNMYFLFVTVTYEDVRLVGAPPSSIGKFGADTDNWEWPRHTGDFSLFRIYADSNNLPAAYSAENVPYRPRHFLPISLDGVEEKDFTLVFGFPGRTDEYLPAIAVEQTVEVLNPARIAIRERALKILDRAMRADEATRIQYASKFASIANYWKKWIGENQGLKTVKAIDKKRNLETEFQRKVEASDRYRPQYGNLLPDFERLYTELEPYALTRAYYSEVFSRNIELLRVAGYFNRLAGYYTENGEPGYLSFQPRLQAYLEGFYKNYRAEIDQEVFGALAGMFAENVPTAQLKEALEEALAKHGAEDYAELAEKLYENTLIANQAAADSLFSMSPEAAVEAMNSDPMLQMALALKEVYDAHVAAPYNEIYGQIEGLQRKYMKAQIALIPAKYYPDANSTLRVTYGQVRGYTSYDDSEYEPHTYLSGVIRKYKPGDYEFDVPEKLRDLYEEKDYGDYADKKGRLPVCFIGTNHTTGGNSGSPALDAYGNLVGLNFDRVWEGTMSDINYDKRFCRNIMVDARYILFVVDKFAGAGHLIEEMKLVHPKEKGYSPGWPDKRVKRGEENLILKERERKISNEKRKK